VPIAVSKKEFKEVSMTASVSAVSPFGDMIARMADWCRDKIAARRAVRELEACPEETAHIAHDIGLSLSELHELARHPPREASLLVQRMAVLHLDPQQLARRDGAVLQDLQRLCTQCASQRRCSRALERSPDDPAWQSYCPNSGTLTVLQARWPAGRTAP
jgi:hypothetical protein